MCASCAAVSECFGGRNGYERGPSAATSLATVRRLILNRRARALMLQPCRCSARRSMPVSSDSTVVLPGSRGFEHHRASQGGLPLFQSLLQVLLRLQDLCTIRDQNCALFVITHKGSVGAPYAVNFFADGGVQPVVWSIPSGQPPTGLSLCASPPATLDGVPTTAGTFTFTVRVTDSQ